MTNHRFFRLLPMLAGIAILATSIPAAAQQPTPAGGRVGYVNLRLVVANMAGFAQAESTLTAEFQAAQTEIERLGVELDSLAQDFERRRIGMTPTASQQRQQELLQRRGQYQARADELQDAYIQREREVLGPFEERALTVIEGIRAERNLGMIFDVGRQGSNIVAADRSLDLTALVVQRLRAAESEN